jgi:hypothetical protein
MRSDILTAAPLVLLPMAAPLVAQQAELPIEPGQRVRVEAPTLFEGWRVGAVTRLGVDTLFLRRGAFTGAGSDDPIPVAALSRIQVSEYRRSHAGKGAWIGALAGFALGAVVGGVLDATKAAEWDSPAGAMTAGLAGIGGAAGALIGLGVGSAQRTDVWRDVSFQRTNVTARRNGSVGVGLSVSLPF